MPGQQHSTRRVTTVSQCGAHTLPKRPLGPSEGQNTYVLHCNLVVFLLACPLVSKLWIFIDLLCAPCQQFGEGTTVYEFAPPAS